MLEPSAFAVHPALLPSPTADAAQYERYGKITWTLDMDDMLRQGVRKHAFDFEAASQHLRSYLLKLRACGGILPDEVSEPLYTAKACRERWSHLDFFACRAFRKLGSGETPAPQKTPAATNSKVAEAEDDEVLNDDGEDSEDEEDDYGIVNLDALRAQRLGGLFGAAPTHKAAVRQANDKKSSMQQRAPPARQSAPMNGRPQPNRQVSAPPSSISASSDAPPAFEQLFGRSQQLAELEQLAAELSSPKPVPASSSSNGAKHGGGVDGSGAVGEHHREAAAALVEPLGELKRRMEGLEALLADEATDMAAKLGEVAQVHREMAELQTLAQQCQRRVLLLCRRPVVQWQPAAQLCASDWRRRRRRSQPRGSARWARHRRDARATRARASLGAGWCAEVVIRHHRHGGGVKHAGSGES